MRLNTQQLAQIKQATLAVFGEQASVRLFGSQLDDRAKGGDIDLLVEVPYNIDEPAALAARLAAKVMIANHGRKVDVLLCAPNLEKQPIHDIALKKGEML